MLIEGLDHPKTLDLAARLKVSLPTAIGHLELLWAFTAKKAPQGNVGKFADGAVARYCHWMGEPETFLQALLQSGFVDAHPEHRYVIHDWHDHAPRWVRAKLAKAKLTFVTTTVATTVATSEESDDSATGDSAPATGDIASTEPTESGTVEPTTVATTEASQSQAKPSQVKRERENARENQVPRESPAGEGNGRALTPYAAMSIELRNRGVKVTSAHPTLVAWVRDGYTVDQLLGALAIARQSLGDDRDVPAAYLDRVLRDTRNWPDIDRPKPNGHGAPTRVRSSAGPSYASVIAALDSLPAAPDEDWS